MDELKQFNVELFGYHEIQKLYCEFAKSLPDYYNGNNSEFAEKCGVRPSTYDYWIKRSFPVGAIIVHPHYDKLVEFMSILREKFIAGEFEPPSSDIDIEQSWLEAKKAAEEFNELLYSHKKANTIALIKKHQSKIKQIA